MILKLVKTTKKLQKKKRKQKNGTKSLTKI